MKASRFNLSLLKQPDAWIPLAMSLAALALVLGHALVYGVVHEADEGAAAHTWQLLMAGQLPFVAYFIIRWLPNHARESLQILALLAATWLANFAAVYWLT
jgi:ABC-type Co2+ transport system permease subunit